MNFTMSRDVPSATCDCGHLACFHVKDDDPPVEKREVERLKQRLESLEDQLDADRHGSLANIVSQYTGIGESAAKWDEDKSHELRNIYGNISRIWQSIQQLETWVDTAAKAQRASLSYRHHGRAHTLDTATENAGHGNDWKPSVTEKEIGSKSMQPAVSSPSLVHHCHPASTGQADQELPLSMAGSGTRPTESITIPNRPLRPVTLEPWTVHISLLPDMSRPFPFERDTVAYKRCLSRGLHRMVVVSGPDADAFTSVVSKTFGHLLQGRPWMPLQARLCAAEQLTGLPMLRPLDLSLQGHRFDHEFLRKHCAVCDSRGKIESLYLAPRVGTLSWKTLKDAPVYIGGLEASWAYDPALDQPGPLHTDSRNERVQIWSDDVISTASKRTAAEISPASNPGASNRPDEWEGPRKLQRTQSGLIDLQLRTGRA
ncbi:hypothetical protein VUR80DRAFT_9236 [Thermomyces stellatus]